VHQHVGDVLGPMYAVALQCCMGIRCNLAWGLSPLVGVHALVEKKHTAPRCVVCVYWCGALLAETHDTSMHIRKHACHDSFPPSWQRVVLAVAGTVLPNHAPHCAMAAVW
jgi:hypothetical protein